MARVARPYNGPFHNCLPMGYEKGGEKLFTQIRSINHFTTRECYFFLFFLSTKNILRLTNILRRTKNSKIFLFFFQKK